MTIHDIAAAVLAALDAPRPVVTTKLQFLVYLGQGWSLALQDEALFPDDFHAWRLGPMSPTLFEHHKHDFAVSAWPWGNALALDEPAQIIVESVVRNYGALGGNQLRDMDHVTGRAWTTARVRAGRETQVTNKRSSSDARDPAVISHDEIRAHFLETLRPYSTARAYLARQRP